MGHNTFCIIKKSVNDKNVYLFLKKEDNILSFFSWRSTAINGSHDHEDFKNAFTKLFGVDDKGYTYPEEIPIDLNKNTNGESIALFSKDVNEHFYTSTSERTDAFVWLSQSDLQKLYDNDSEESFTFSERWIIPYLLNPNYDVCTLPPVLVETLKKIKEAYERKKLVIFAGAGISKASGAPLWGEISGEIIKSLGINDGNYIEPTLLGQWLYNERGEKEYNEKLREVVGYNKGLSPNPIHEEIVKVNPYHIVQTTIH